MTLNLHIPTLIPLTETPDALQILTDDPTTVNRTLDDEDTVNFANTAIDLALVDLFIFTTGACMAFATVVVVVAATVVSGKSARGWCEMWCEIRRHTLRHLYVRLLECAQSS